MTTKPPESPVETAFIIAIESGTVVIRFKKPVLALGLPPDTAVALADALLTAAEELRRKIWREKRAKKKENPS